MKYSLILLLSLPMFNGQAIELSICNDGTRWPPYFIKGGQYSNGVGGISTELLREVLKRKEIKNTIEAVPWKRYFNGVFKNRYYQMPFDASSSPERREKCHLSEIMYKIRHAFYYNKTEFPYGPDIKKFSDLDKYRVCSIYGYNLANYKFKTIRVDEQAKANKTLITKLRKNKYQLIIGYLEVWQTFEKMGKFELQGA